MTPLETVVQFVLRMAASLAAPPEPIAVPVRVPQAERPDGRRSRRAPPAQLVGW
jgi:hypothetical protein